ncbi:MAG: c-type cytochrome [Chitinophagaceae bacterium]
MIPIAAFVVKKVSSQSNVSDNPAVPIDYKIPEREAPLKGAAYKGKMMFMQKCAACHNPFKDGTGPSILGFEQRGTWGDRQNLYAWIRNPAEFMKRDPYTRALKEKFGSMMTGFPDITDEEIDNIVAFLNLLAKQRGY